jgi:CheY-like chemotaxis protein
MRLLRRAFDRTEPAVELKWLPNGDAAVDYLSGIGSYSDRLVNPLPALVLLDLKLPRRSGLEVIAWIRSQIGTLKTLPVVMLTSSNHLLDVNRAYESGVNSFITKPATSVELERITRVLKHYWLTVNQAPIVLGGSIASI